MGGASMKRPMLVTILVAGWSFTMLWFAATNNALEYIWRPK